jgi:hypothetical protein
MKYWILILLTSFLMLKAPETCAHNLVSANGITQDHQHVYRRQEYGKPLQQGHRIQSAGGSGVIIWGADARPEYGKSLIRRSGPIIGDHKLMKGRRSYRSNKYGSAVNGYGKAVRGYGKPSRDYGKPSR